MVELVETMEKKLPTIKAAPNTNKDVAELVRKWGGSTSVALLDPECQLYWSSNYDGVIGYKLGKNCVVSFGDPVCSPEHTLSLVESFHEYCQSKNLGVVYTAASQQFAKLAKHNVCHAWLQVGEELIVDPHHDPMEGAKGRKLRNKVSHCQNAGVSVSEYTDNNEKLEKDIDHVATAWLKARKGPQIYLANVNLFDNRAGKRWFYARQGNKIVGALLLNQLEAKQGWLINLLLTTPEAPHGTSEMLVVNTLKVLRDEGCHYLSLGGATGDKVGEMEGLGSLSKVIAQIGFQLAKWMLPLDDRRTYWKKFQPNSQPSYLLFSKHSFGINEVLSVMKALNVSFTR